MYPVEQFESVTDYYPEICGCCGEKLNGEDANPYRHQVVEIPRISQLAVELLGERNFSGADLGGLNLAGINLAEAKA